MSKAMVAAAMIVSPALWTAPCRAAAQRLVLQQADVAATRGVTARLGTVTFGAGDSVAPHRHQGVELIYVVSGHVVVSIAGAADKALGPGESIQIARDAVHGVRATSDGPAMIVASWTTDLGAPVAVPPPADTKQQ